MLEGFRVKFESWTVELEGFRVGLERFGVVARFGAVRDFGVGFCGGVCGEPCLAAVFCWWCIPCFIPCRG